jgi:hypothetical protein
LWVTCNRWVVFSGYSRFLHQLNWPPRYNWNIVESGVKHQNPNPSITCYFFIVAVANVVSQIENKVNFYCTGSMSPNTALSPVMLSSVLPRNPTYPPPAVKVGYTGKYIKYVSFLWHKILVLIINMFIYVKVGHSIFVGMQEDTSDF